ncbi:unnamed protein product [Owenia fusiformis]|nr:unnamed protein product [Owenia fusiformis]
MVTHVYPFGPRGSECEFVRDGTVTPPEWKLVTTPGTLVDFMTDATCNLAEEFGGTGSGKWRLTIVIQEGNTLQMSDAMWEVQCVYKAPDGTLLGPNPMIQVQNINKKRDGVADIVKATNVIDRAYSLDIIRPDGEVFASGVDPLPLPLGTVIKLKITGTGPDTSNNDEQGVRVKSCWIEGSDADGNDLKYYFLDNYCPAGPDQILRDRSIGFKSFKSSSGDPIYATSPSFNLFSLPSDVDNELQFNCIIELCHYACANPDDPVTIDGKEYTADGVDNCEFTRRRRRAVNETLKVDGNESEVIVRKPVFVLPPKGAPGIVGDAPHNSNTRISQSNGVGIQSCVQSRAFLVTVCVLGLLLVLSLIVATFMCHKAIQAKSKGLQRRDGGLDNSNFSYK